MTGSAEVTPLFYTNSVRISLSVYDVVLDVGIEAVVEPQRTVRIVMSPQHAKALSTELAETVKRYEDCFGQIPEYVVQVNEPN